MGQLAPELITQLEEADRILAVKGELTKSRCQPPAGLTDRLAAKLPHSTGEGIAVILRDGSLSDDR